MSRKDRKLIDSVLMKEHHDYYSEEANLTLVNMLAANKNRVENTPASIIASDIDDVPIILIVDDVEVRNIVIGTGLNPS